MFKGEWEMVRVMREAMVVVKVMSNNDIDCKVLYYLVQYLILRRLFFPILKYDI